MRTRYEFLSVSAASLVLATLVSGCASDPNKNVASASDEESRTSAEYQSKHANLTAEQRSEQLALEKTQREERAALNGERERAQVTTQTDVEKARADMLAERKAFISESNEKLQKATARADEFQKKSTKLNAKAKSSYQTNLAHYVAKRSEVTSEINGLDTVQDTNWERAKSSVRARIDELDHAVDGIGKHF